ncbi:hypothetical protein B0T18DRAFT_100673 [Schizothecium vesticola]|uniref:Uncharacterized protein n=1 Tax=Schizothecium vesticola TaxID=314040 RepID=A0AA40F1M6_9PEZI|nr:hypothetical protein B0T18DRAFT_100673 [Schizothecium vesticola]
MKTSDISPPASDTESTPPESDTESSPPASEKKYSVEIIMAPPQSPHDTNISLHNAPWAVTVELKGVNLDFMEEGLFWTTQNVLFLAGCQDSLDTAATQEEEYYFPWAQNVVRTWELREFPGRPEARSRWHGEVVLRTRSVQTLAGFCLGQLTRQMICRAWVFDDAGKMIFRFNPESTTAMNKNELFDGDPFDLWWLWPMESIIPEEAEGSSRPQAGGGEEKRAPDGRVTDDRVSWPDVAALLCAAPAMSILAVAWGTFVLFTAASTVVLEFGGYKGKREPVCHATENRASWTDLVVRLFTGMAGSFRGVSWLSWKDLVIGVVASVWGVGSFVLLANEVLHNRSELAESFRGVAWPSWGDFVRGAVVGTWGIGCFLLLADEVLHNRSGYIKLFLGRRWPSWSGLIIGVVMSIWGVGIFVLLAREVLHNGPGFLAESFRGVQWPCWWDMVWGAVVGTWGIGCFGLLATRLLWNVL